jgi:hypothetical protein
MVAMLPETSKKARICSFVAKCSCTKHKKATANLTAAKQHTKKQERIRRRTIMKLPSPVSEDRIALVHGAKELVWLSLHLQLNPETVCYFYENLCRSIFTVPIPGNPRGHTGRPTKKMLDQAIKAVIKFYDTEEALGERSAIYQSFMIASAEKELSFDWNAARRRVSQAKFDVKKQVDKWEDCLAMSHGDSQGEVEIAVCGTKPMTITALTALLCHEGLHNFAKRTRPGQRYLSAEIEHVAMALMGDPQL